MGGEGDCGVYPMMCWIGTILPFRGGVGRTARSRGFPLVRGVAWALRWGGPRLPIVIWREGLKWLHDCMRYIMSETCPFAKKG